MRSSFSSTLEKKYIPASEAGKHFGYTRNYMLMLIKQGKIDGKKVGSKWFIDILAAEKYFFDAKNKMESRRRLLSEERKKELHLIQGKKEPVSFWWNVPTVSQHAKIALLETCAIVFLGITVGSLGYVGTQTAAAVDSSEKNILSEMAITIYTFFSGGSSDGVSAPQVADNGVVTEPLLPIDNHAFRIASPVYPFATSTVGSLRDSFSDPVRISVDENDPRRVWITPEFRSGEGEPYEFLMIPVTSEDDIK